MHFDTLSFEYAFDTMSLITLQSVLHGKLSGASSYSVNTSSRSQRAIEITLSVISNLEYTPAYLLHNSNDVDMHEYLHFDVHDILMCMSIL